MRKTNQAGYLMRLHGWWVLRYRERVGAGAPDEPSTPCQSSSETG